MLKRLLRNSGSRVHIVKVSSNHATSKTCPSSQSIESVEFARLPHRSSGETTFSIVLDHLLTASLIVLTSKPAEDTEGRPCRSPRLEKGRKVWFCLKVPDLGRAGTERNDIGVHLKPCPPCATHLLGDDCVRQPARDWPAHNLFSCPVKTTSPRREKLSH